MSKLKRITRDYLTFSKKERNIAIYITTAIIIVVFLPVIVANFSSEQTQFDYTAMEQLHILIPESDEAENSNEKIPFYTNKPYNNSRNTFSAYDSKFSKKDDYKKEVTLFYFDPNTISAEQWMQLGIPEKLAERIINYRNKGGTFKQKEDLMKTYGFNQNDFERIYDFIQIDSTQFVKNKITKTTIINTGDFKTKQINIADKSDLMALGFTADNAIRIINFREANGGIYAIEQLYSVFGIDMEILQAASPFLEIDENQIQMMSLNYINFEQLAKHTYISDDLAKAIIEYRNTTGKFYSITELMKVKGMYPSLYEKLKPYFTL